MLDKLEAFKSWMQKDFKKHCEEKYGKVTYSRFIKSRVEDLLEDLEADIEVLAERQLREDAISYDSEG